MASGSDKRQRDKILVFRCTLEEFNAIADKADKAGFAKGAFARATLLGDSGPRAQRRPPADHKALRQILGQILRTGNNVNQVAHALNAALKAGEKASLPVLKEVLRVCLETRDAILDIRDAIYVALGKNPGPRP